MKLHTTHSLLIVTALTALSMSGTSVQAKDQTNNQPSNQVEIDRSVLQELKGYEPPPMFGGTPTVKSTASNVVLKKPPVALPTAQELTTPKAEDVLGFPVQNSEVVTRQRLTAPEETIHTVTPDYSDSRTVIEARNERGDVLRYSKKRIDLSNRQLAKAAPLPGKKPELILASYSGASAKEDTAKVTNTQEEFPLQAEVKKLSKVEPAATSQAEVSITPPAKPAAKYVPKARPTMPAVPSGDVEKAALDPFSLPLQDNADKATVVAKPTPGERLMDQALSRNMINADKKDVESVMSGTPVENQKTLSTTKIAAIPVTAPTYAQATRLTFKSKITEIDKDQQAQIKADVLDVLKKNSEQRIQIQAFSDKQSAESDERRISLSRALSVRSWLLDHGIEPHRIDVRAMGNNTKESPEDRVDILFSSVN